MKKILTIILAASLALAGLAWVAVKVFDEA